MARFRATIRGQRGEASRLGSTKSGITAEVNGWDVGVYVSADAGLDRDRFYIYATGGSHDNGGRCIGTVQLVGGKPTFEAR